MISSVTLPKAMFFDFDGVIVDSTKVKTEAFRELFRAYPDPIVNEVVAYHRMHGGISRVDKIRYSHEKIIEKPLFEEQVAAWSQKYSELVVEQVIAASWIPGAKELLDSLGKDMLVFVISGTPQDELRAVLERRMMSDYFLEILGSPVRKAEHIRMLLEKYQLEPQQCLFVGDAMTDYHAAQETGLKFVGIRSEIDFPEGTLVLPDCKNMQQAIAQLYSQPGN